MEVSCPVDMFPLSLFACASAEFQIESQQTGFEADTAESTHAIQLPIPNTDNVDTIFDAISYEKALCVI
jgi:aminopeptidase N